MWTSKCRAGTTNCQLGKARGTAWRFFGGGFAGLPRDRGALCTDSRAASTYRTINTEEWRTSMLSTTRILVSMLGTARAFLFAHGQPARILIPLRLLLIRLHFFSPVHGLCFLSNSCFGSSSSPHYRGAPLRRFPHYNCLPNPQE